MIGSRILVGCAILGLVSSGCLQLIRRHPTPLVEETGSGNPAQVQDVQGSGSENAEADSSPALSTVDSVGVEEMPPVDAEGRISAQPQRIVADSTVVARRGASGETPGGAATMETAAAAQPERAGEASASRPAVADSTVQTPSPGPKQPQRLAQLPRPKAYVETVPEAPSTSAENPDELAVAAAKSARVKRTKGMQGSVKQINEYAFWCIENGLWKEARTHLEYAIEQDSTSASLFNNIGIVYEHFGAEEQALAAYQRAYALNPKQRRYRGNIDLLERRWRAVPDTLGRIEIFDMDQPNALDSTAVATPESAAPAPDEGSEARHPSMVTGAGDAHLHH